MKTFNMEEVQNLYKAVTTTATGGTMGQHKRFIVSLTNNKTDIKTLTLEKLLKILSDLKGLADAIGLKSFCLGYWNDPQGVLYIDLNISFNVKAKALNIGNGFKQQAIYDTLNDTTINI